ncbi:MAG TPA: long-chain fatty acid--CoA ligase [Syntrophobacteraceae bacterium]|nr:long-chain fatty acid--CoA ligase [Syntrophobacteraceae bacterium]
MAPVKLIDRTPSAYSYPLLIKHLLRTPLIHAPKQEIVYRELKRYDYDTFAERVGRLANTLKSLGVAPGDTIGVMDWDSHRYLECYFAIPMMGAVLHTVNIRLSPEQILYTIDHAEDDVILVNTDFIPLLEQIRDKLKTVRKIIVLTDTETVPDVGLEIAGEYEALLRKNQTDYDFPDFDENAKATTFYTTGTTGLPKGVYFSHRQLVLHTLSTMGSLAGHSTQGGFNSRDVYMPLTPMFHVHAWGIPYVASLLGVKQVYPGRYVPDSILNLIKTEKVTFSHCVPTILHMLLSSPLSAKVDLSAWKVIIGGSALSKGLCRTALDRGINVFSGYGMSETCPILTIANFKPHMSDLSLEQQVEIRCRTGLPVPLVDLRAIDSVGREQPYDGVSVGEVVARSPWLTQGYFRETERSEELWRDGYLHTADIGFIDKEGYLQVTDRIKDVIKTGGEWISSLQIEDILTQHQAVSEAAVIGVPDEKWGERPLALVTLKEDFIGKVLEEDIKDFFKEFVGRGFISKWGIPDKVIFVDKIPRTSVGKLNKLAIRKQFSQ